MDINNIDNTSGVPLEYMPYVNRLRRSLKDFPELNELFEDFESSDLQLYEALQDTLDELNYEIEPVGLTYADLSKVPSWNVVKTGAILNVLTEQGILSARNILTYNDAGGITVKEEDRYGRYMAFFNMLINKYLRQAQAMKRGANVDAAYGGIHSEYNFYNTTDW
jgi:hypothetical protein